MSKLAANKCAPLQFVTGVVGGDTDPCDVNVELEQAGSCNLKCAVGYVAQTATVTCAAGASQDDVATGAIAACVGRYQIRRLRTHMSTVLVPCAKPHPPMYVFNC